MEKEGKIWVQSGSKGEYSKKMDVRKTGGKVGTQPGLEGKNIDKRLRFMFAGRKALKLTRERTAKPGNTPDRGGESKKNPL